jgi:hypothetical protein
MNAAKKSATRLILRSWSRLVGVVSTTREHTSWLLVRLRQLRDDERALNDALCARALTFQTRLPASSQDLLGEWEAIERSSRPMKAKLLALRVLYLSLAEQCARAKRDGADAEHSH